MVASIQEVVPMLNDFLAVTSFLVFLLDKFLAAGVSPRLLEVNSFVYLECNRFFTVNLQKNIRDISVFD